MKVLFIGGTGVISTASTQLCLERGIDIYLLTRSKSHRPIPAGVKVLTADYHNISEAKSVLADLKFDVVVNWIAFTAEDIEYDINIFRDKTSQYIFISSATVYQRPPSTLPITESEILSNFYSAYSSNKIYSEERLVKAFREENFPMTIVRPSHTYDKTLVPMGGDYTILKRIKEGKKIIIHGDGSSLWTMTHNSDFAKGIVGLFGRSTAIGQAYHITSDEILTWNQINEIFAQHLGVSLNIVHISSDTIAKFDTEWGNSLLGDKTHSLVFDNTKIKNAVPDFQATIPFSIGAREIVDWYESDTSRQKVDAKLDSQMDRLIEKVETIKP